MSASRLSPLRSGSKSPQRQPNAVYNKTQEDARRYCQEHGLETLLTSMINAAVKARPADLDVFIAKWFTQQLSSQQLTEAGLRRITSGEKDIEATASQSEMHVQTKEETSEGDCRVESKTDKESSKESDDDDAPDENREEFTEVSSGSRKYSEIKCKKKASDRNDHNCEASHDNSQNDPKS